MDIEEVYELIKGNREKEFFYITGGDCDINIRDTDGQSLLHYAVQANDLETTKFLLKEGIIYNNKDSRGKTPQEITHVDKIKKLLQICSSFLMHVKAGNFDEVSKYVSEHKLLVNIQEQGAFTPLHLAANYGNENIARLLLENGAKVVQFTESGLTPLHIAVSKRAVSIAKLLLEAVKSYDLLLLINAQMNEIKNTCLHIAAANGYLEIIKLLLKYGAIYEIANEHNQIPLDLCKARKARRFLKAIDNFFVYAKDGDSRLVDELSEMEITEFEAVSNAQNCVYHTLIQELIFFNHKNAAQKLLRVIKKNKTEKMQRETEKLKTLQSSANVYLYCSKTYMEKLRSYSLSNEYDTNQSQWIMLKEGSYLLGNAYTLVEDYKNYNNGLIDDECLLIVDATLKKLQFNKNHISGAMKFEGYSDPSIVFASKAEGYEYYYNLLHSILKSDCRHFIKIVEHYIDKPIQKFLEDVEEQKEFFISLSSHLMECVKQENYLGVCECITQGADVNFLSDNKESPLQQAIQKISTKIVKILLEAGACVKENSALSNGNTHLHVAAMLDSTVSKQEDAPLVITKYLLQHGARYNATNNNGETAENVSNIQNIKIFLKEIDTCFKYADDDNVDLISKLQNMEVDDFKAATQSHSKENYTLFQTAITAKHRKIESALLNILQGHKATPENV